MLLVHLASCDICEAQYRLHVFCGKVLLTCSAFKSLGCTRLVEETSTEVWCNKEVASAKVPSRLPSIGCLLKHQRERVSVHVYNAQLFAIPSYSLDFILA